MLQVLSFVPTTRVVRVSVDLVDFAVVHVTQHGRGCATGAVAVGHVLPEDVVAGRRTLRERRTSRVAGAPRHGVNVLAGGRVDLHVLEIEAQGIFAIDPPVKRRRGELAFGGLKNVLLSRGRLHAAEEVPRRGIVIHVVDAGELAQVDRKREVLVHRMRIVDVEAGLDRAGLRV